MQPQHDDTRNLVITMVFASIILLGWHFFYDAPRLKAEAARKAAQQEQLAHEQAQQPSASETAKLPEVADAATQPPAANTTVALTREQALQETGRIKIHSDALHGSLSLKGARFDDLTLARYHETLAKDSPEVTLLSPARTAQVYFAEMGWLPASDGIVTPSAETVWQSTDTQLTPGNSVILFWENPQGVRFEMEVAMDRHYMFTITQRVINHSGAVIALAPYGLINRTHNQIGKKYYILHEGPLGIEDDALFEADYEQLKEEGPVTINDTHGWLGITDKYWLTAIIPEKGRFKATYQHYAQGTQDRFQTDLLAQAVKVTPGNSTSYTTRFFAGAKEVWLLDEYATRHAVPLFDRAVDFGSLYFLTKPIFRMLDYFYKLLGNFGLAILLLTVIIKLLLFPLASKSYNSMAQMKLLMPKMEEIRQRYKDGDKVQMNQEIIQLYKREGVNPASGCLPMLIQIPVFFSLYKVLFVTIEMRHAPFYGWVQDLSAIDPTNIFTLFGLIAWDPPSFLHVGVWPLIMTITMIIQQRISPKPNDPVQAQVMQTLPYVFLFLFASFPAGLVIYWAWNNTLSIVQQLYISKRLANRPPKKPRRRKAAEDEA